MKNQTLYLLLMLSLLLGQNSIANANSGESDPMNVKTTNSAQVSVSEKETSTEKDEAVKPSDSEKKEEEVKAEESKPKEKQIVTHSVKQGESLWRIAQQYLGDGNRWRELVELNKEAYPTLEKNPNLIYTGWQIKVALDDESSSENQTIDNATTDSSNTASSTVSVSDSSTDSSSVNQSEIPNWTTKQKIEKLQECLDKANRALLAQNKKIADLNLGTINFMIKYGFMKQEDWMAMNPPVGYTYKIDKNGKVELVNAKNVALTADEIAKLDSKLATDSSTATKPTDAPKWTNIKGQATNGIPKDKFEKEIKPKIIKLTPTVHGGGGASIPPSNSSSSHSNSAASQAGETLGGIFKTFSELISEAQETAKSVGEDLKQSGKDFSDAAKETSQNISEAAKETAKEAQQLGKDVADSAKQTVEDVKGSVKQAGDDFKEGFNRGYNRDYYGKGSEEKIDRKIAEEDFKAKQEAHDAYIRAIQKRRLLEEK